VFEFEPMTYGSESECATHYTTAPHKVAMELRLGHAAASNGSVVSGLSECVLSSSLSFLRATNTRQTYRTLSISLLYGFHPYLRTLLCNKCTIDNAQVGFDMYT